MSTAVDAFQSDSRAEPTFQLDELDRSLRPLRRVLAWADRDVDANVNRVRYLGANGARWISGALRLDLPGAVRDPLGEIAGGLAGFDEADDDTRRTRLRAMYQTLTRLDALLGLPLDGPASPTTTAPLPVDLGLTEPLTDEDDGSVLEIEEAGPVDDAAAPDRRYRLADPAHTGAALVDRIDGALALALAEDGIETIADLLLLPPTRETLLKPVHGAGRDLPDGRVAVGGRIGARFTRVSAAGERITEISLQGAGPLKVRWTRPVAPWFIERLEPGTRVVLVGASSSIDGERVLLDPEPAVADGHSVRLADYGVEGVDDVAIRVLLWRFLPMVVQIRDPLDAAARNRLELPELADAITWVHTFGTARPDARRRLAFDEALLLQLGLASPRFQAGRERGFAHPITHALAARMLQHMEIANTDGQQVALEDIKRDLKSTVPMARVLTGAAGTGKFLVALQAAVTVADAKAQVMFVGADAMSAELRYLFAEPLLREIGLVARLAVGEPNRAQRDAIRRGEVHVVFGGSDLFDYEVEYRRLGLVIAEEREPWGRAPAKVSAMRAPRPDLLVLGTTPIPAAVMLSAYGDHDLSVVQSALTSPKISIFPEERREEAYKRASEACARGRQAIVVFPMAKSEDDRVVDVLDLRDARQVIDVLANQMLPGLRVGLFHGQQPREDRMKVYDDLLHRRIDVMIATAPIEDGPPIASATVMLVEQADRMPLHRLQRLTGHVANGIGDEAELVFITGRTPDDDGVERLKRIAEARDPWDVAEWDAQKRGLETLLARDVHGGSRLRWLDPVAHREILVIAREEAHGLLTDDPSLRRGSHGDIARNLRERWDELLTTPCPLPADGASAPGAASQKRRRRRRKRK